MYPDWFEKVTRAIGERYVGSNEPADSISSLVYVLLRQAYMAGLEEAKTIVDDYAEYYRAHYKPGAVPTARELAKAIELKREQCFQAPWPPMEEAALAEEEKSDV